MALGMSTQKRPTDFFFHAMSGRDALVSTEIRTAKTGYMQRRLISALEDLKLTPEGSIKNTTGTIIQFKYGEDGTDPTRAVRGKSVDPNDLFTEVLGEKADSMLNVDQKKNQGDDYGTREKDFEGYEDFDSEDGEESLDYDYDSDSDN